jgi:hypothetical protein
LSQSQGITGISRPITPPGFIWESNSSRVQASFPKTDNSGSLTFPHEQVLIHLAGNGKVPISEGDVGQASKASYVIWIDRNDLPRRHANHLSALVVQTSV